MRRHIILTSSSRVALFDPPGDLELAQRRYVLDPDDIVWAHAHRRAHNRLGFAVQLALVHDLGRAWLPNEVLPDAVIEAVSDQLGIEPFMFEGYAARQETRREHAREIFDRLGAHQLNLMIERHIRPETYQAAIATIVDAQHGEPFAEVWLMDPLMRRRSNSNLNKGENRHSLARAVFFHRLGELRDRTAENLSHRAAGLHLVVNAIIHWNTVYLARAVDFVASQGVDIPAEQLARVAPVNGITSPSPATISGATSTSPASGFDPLEPGASDPTTSKSLSGYHCTESNGTPYRMGRSSHRWTIGASASSSAAGAGPITFAMLMTALRVPLSSMHPRPTD